MEERVTLRLGPTCYDWDAVQLSLVVSCEHLEGPAVGWGWGWGWRLGLAGDEGGGKGWARPSVGRPRLQASVLEAEKSVSFTEWQ